MATSANEQEYKGNVINYLNTTGNTAITLSSNGLTLADDILTTPIIVEINQVGIVNGGNTTTWNTLASLDQALASLKIPPNATTLEIENTLLATNGATNSISINASTPNIVITDGTITNTIDKNGYTTRNNVQNSTKYINFSDSSTTGTGEIQKTSSLSCNPSLGTITASIFNGDLNGNASSSSSSTTSTTIDITDTDVNSVYYPTFVSTSGTNQTLRADISTTPLSYNPSTSNLTATTFTGSLSGNASSSTNSTNSVNIGITSDNTNGAYYLPFAKTSGTGDKPLYIDDTSTPLTYNPSTSNLTATIFTGDLVGNASSSTNISITDTNTSATYYPTFVDSSGSGKTLRADIGTGPFSINPNTGVLNFATTMKITSDKIGLGGNAGIFSQGNNAIAIGLNAGNSSQGASGVAIGVGAGQGTTSGQGAASIAIGSLSGQVSQGASSVAIGQQAGNTTQGGNSVAIGASAGRTTQGSSSIAIGNSAGFTGQGANSIAIGSNTGVTNQTANSIAINASGVTLDTSNAGLYIDPIRNVSQTTVLGYDTVSKEITYYPTPGGGGGGLSVETVTGTTALSPAINISLVSGTSHTLPLSSSPGFTKTIVNNNPNVFGRITTDVSSGVGGPVIIRSLRYDPVLDRMYIGGNYTNINAVSGASVFTYYDFTSSTFVGLGTFTGVDIYDILIVGTKVFITGAFTQINGIASTQRIAYYDTSTSVWSAMGTGLSSGQGQKLLSYAGFLYVCGTFALAGGVAGTVKIAKWNIGAGTWSTVGVSGISSGSVVNDMALIGTNIWVSGNFTVAAGAANSQYLAYWDTIANSWNGYGTAQFTGGSISALKYIGGDSLIVSGAFTQLGSSYMYYTCNYNVSTLTGVQFGIGCLPTNTFFIDTDGLLWNCGNAGTLGSISVGFNSSYYSPAGGIAFWNTSTGCWIPITCGQNVNVMEKTGTPGVYWLCGAFSGWDGSGTLGFALTGMGGIVSFNKNNITIINSTLLNSGSTGRNNFNLYYKGQSINLVNIDNSNWNVSTIQSNPIPYTWLY